MPVTISPAAEACQAIVARINAGSGGLYTLPTPADYYYQLTEVLDVSGTAVQVDVIHEGEKDLEDTLDVETRTSHDLRVWVRKKISDRSKTTIDPLLLLVRQLFQQLNNYGTSRVKVWDINAEDDDQPDKGFIRQTGLFSASLLLRVEVEASP